MNHTYILIMAGGEGTRFAPLSTPDKPKQFLNFIGEASFLQQTRARVADLVPAERILVATNERYHALVKEQLPDIPDCNIVTEPVKRNTAPCIAYSARLIQERDKDAVMLILPSDHVIGLQDRFLDVVRTGVKSIRAVGGLLTLGIRPEWPSSDYGYIRASKRNVGKSDVVRGVEDFVEKPDEATAQQYIDRGDYYWNSGMFMWSVTEILREFSLHLPDIDAALKSFSCSAEYKASFFERVHPISIDYGILEKTQKAAVIPCALDWSDVGTWESLYQLFLRGTVTISRPALEAMKQQLGYESLSVTES